MQGKRTATATVAQRTADHGDQKGEVNMTTPNTGELLVQQAQEAERLRLLILADECNTPAPKKISKKRLTKYTVPCYIRATANNTTPCTGRQGRKGKTP